MAASVLGYQTPIIGQPYSPPDETSGTPVLGGRTEYTSTTKAGTATIERVEEPKEAADVTPIERELRNGEGLASPAMSSAGTQVSEEAHPELSNEIERVATYRAMLLAKRYVNRNLSREQEIRLEMLNEKL